MPKDPLTGMRPVPAVAPPFEPGKRYTYERMIAQLVDPQNFLLPEEIQLAHWVLRKNKDALAWDESEKGRFLDQYFNPIKIATIAHIPWVVRNIPLAPGL
jgi:hypothetical protein